MTYGGPQFAEFISKLEWSRRIFEAHPPSVSDLEVELENLKELALELESSKSKVQNKFDARRRALGSAGACAPRAAPLALPVPRPRRAERAQPHPPPTSTPRSELRWRDSGAGHVLDLRPRCGDAF